MRWPAGAACSERRAKPESPNPASRNTVAGGGGGDSSIKMPRCVCWGSENVPILKDALGKKIYPS